MRLILAIEPDRRQAARVSALGRGALDAELLVAESTERGVEALGGRRPDLILTSLLLSPKDEADLRDLDRSGEPVPTLMIPVLASSSRSKEGRGGLLARLHISKQQAEPTSGDGCDPKMFAAQIEEYLTHAAEQQESRAAERRHESLQVREEHQVADVHAIPAPQPVVEPEPQVVQEFYAEPEPTSEVRETSAPSEILQVQESHEGYETYQDVVAPPPVTHVDEVAPTPDVFVPAEPAVIHAVEPVLQVDTHETQAAYEAEPVHEYEPEPVQDIEREQDIRRAAADEEVAFNLAADWEEIVLEEVDEDAPIELSSETIDDLQAFVDELKTTYADLFPRNEMAAARNVVEQDEVRPVQEIRAPHKLREVPRTQEARAIPREAPQTPSAPAGRVIAMPLPASLAPTSSAQAATVAHALPSYSSWPVLEGLPADEQPVPDIAEIVADFAAALEDFAGEPDNPGHGDPDSELWMPLASAAGTFWPRLESTCSRRRPMQDEWGFFDPDQCGFSALVAKLDQISR
jgi:hypothetical protein